MTELDQRKVIESASLDFSSASIGGSATLLREIGETATIELPVTGGYAVGSQPQEVPDIDQPAYPTSQTIEVGGVRLAIISEAPTATELETERDQIASELRPEGSGRYSTQPELGVPNRDTERMPGLHVRYNPAPGE